LLRDSSKCLKEISSWKTSFSIDRGKEFKVISAANESEGLDIGQSLNIITRIMISDIILKMIISIGIEQ
jgi:hypothetical protein